MATKKRAKARKSPGPTCSICSDTMKLKSVIPAAHIFAELKTFQCGGCGNLRTMEDAELSAGDALKAAA
jgi:hypothetical protein